MTADRSVLVRLRADISDFQRKFAAAGTTASVFVKQLDTADSRMGNLVQTALALGPALVPISASATPALVGLTSQLGFAAAGAGALVAAMNGVGDALGAVNDYQLEPSNANLQKMQEAMSKLPKDGREFVRFLDKEVLPALDRLQDVAAEGALDGVQDGIDDLLTRLPQVRRIVSDLAEGAGTLASEMGAGLASDEFDEFFRFLKAEAEPTLVTFGRTVGNVLDGLATTLIGLNPLANDFEEALLDWSRGFADMDPSDFEDFVAYVRDVGPDALDALTAVGGAFVAIIKAASPVGEVVLPVLEALAETIEAIAESPAGPVLIGTAAGLSAVSRSIAVFNAANGSALLSTVRGVKTDAPGAATGLGRMNSTISALKTGGPIIGALALSMTDLDDKIGLSNTAMFTMLGTLAGPWGAAVGAAVGLTMDLKAANDNLNDSFEATRDVIRSGTFDEQRKKLRELRDEIEEFEAGKIVGDTGDGFLSDLKSELAIVADRFTGANDKRKQFVDELRAQRGMGDVGTIYAQGLGMTEDAFDAASSSALKFRESLGAVNRALEGRANLRDYQAALDDFTDSVKDNGRTLDITTEAGRSNQAALDSIATTALSVAENFKGMNRVRVLEQARGDFIDAAMDVGRTRKQAEALATELGLLDRQKAEPKVDADTKLAKRKLDELKDGLALWDGSEGEAKAEVDGRAALAALLGLEGKMNALDGKTSNLYVTTTLRTVRQGAPGPQDPSSARGNLFSSVRSFARGDIANGHQPELAGPGPIRMWREPETQGEAYIPLANDSRRPRARNILDETARILGARSVEWYASGGNNETAAQKKAREAREEARRRQEERERREEEKRQRQLDKQRTKDLLASRLRDEQEQQNLEIQNARRRLKSAREADRPKAEINELKLALKQELADRNAMREQRRIEAKEKADEELQRLEEERIEAEKERADAIFEGQQRAWDTIADAAKANIAAAEELQSGIKADMDQLGQTATARFRGTWFEQQARQHGLWVGANTNGVGDWRSKANADIAGLQERAGLITRLSDPSLGLSPKALEDLLGNQDNAGIAAMLAAGEVDDFAAMFKQYEDLLGGVSTQAGRAGYGTAYDAATSELVTVNEQLARLNALIASARPITVNEAVSAAATAAEIARLQGNY